MKGMEDSDWNMIFKQSPFRNKMFTSAKIYNVEELVTSVRNKRLRLKRKYALVASFAVILLFISSLYIPGHNVVDIIRGKNAFQEQPKPSSFFHSGSYDLQGIEGKLGLLVGLPFKAGQPNKYMWHFWGIKSNPDQHFKVTAFNFETGKTTSALLGPINDNSEIPKTIEEQQGIYGPINGADAHVLCSMMLPKPGIWRLDVFIDNKLFGSINVQVSP